MSSGEDFFDAIDALSRGTKSFMLKHQPLTSIVASTLILAGIMWSGHKLGEYHRAFKLQIGDYNGNQIRDSYYVIRGVKVPVEIDGKPIAEYFK